MIRFAFYFVISLLTLVPMHTVSGKEGDRLSKMQDRLLNASLRSPSDADKVFIKNLFEDLEISSLQLGRFCVECVGDFSLDTSDDFYLSHFGFLHAEDSKSSERTIYTLQPLIMQGSRIAATQTANSMTVFQGNDIDLLRMGKDYFSHNPNLDHAPLNTELAKKQLSQSEVFDPFMASLSSAGAILESKSQKVDFSLYDVNLVKGIVKIDEFVIFSFQFQGQVKILRTVVFADRVPVLLEDKTMVNGKSLSLGYTKTSWEIMGDKHLPVLIEAIRLPNLGSARELRVEMKWKFGENVPDQFFNEKSVGKLGFASQ